MPALRGRLGGSWRLYTAWGRCERPKQDPPTPKAVMRALAGWFEKQGHRGAAPVIVVAFHHILRSNMFMAIVGTDVVVESGYLLVIWRDAKIGHNSASLRRLNARSCRGYIISALADLSSEEIETSLI